MPCMQSRDLKKESEMHFRQNFGKPVSAEMSPREGVITTSEEELWCTLNNLGGIMAYMHRTEASSVNILYKKDTWNASRC